MNNPFEGVKVFSATKMADRNMLGEQITDWLRSNPDKEVVDKIVTQSSDSEFHCIAITLFYKFVKVATNENGRRLKFAEDKR